MYIYDKDYLDMIKTMIIDERYNVYFWPDGLYKFSKYYNQNLIGISLNPFDNNLIWYKVCNNVLKKKSIINTNLYFADWNYADKIVFKYLYILMDKRIILFRGKKYL